MRREIRMDDSILPRERRWWRRVLLVVGGSVLLFVAGVVMTSQIVDEFRYTHETPQLVGVWVGESGNVFQLNADGTGRGRASHTERIQFLRWNQRDGSLSVFFEPKRKSLAWKTEQMLRGLPKCAHFRYRIDSVNDLALQLHDPTSDKQLRFTRDTVEAFDRQDVPNSDGLRTESAGAKGMGAE